jgi:hypothetical protein
VAVTYTGSTCVPCTTGISNSGQLGAEIFLIENTSLSSKDLRIMELQIQNDFGTGLLVSNKSPVISLKRATTTNMILNNTIPSGIVLCAKNPFNSAQTSDPYIRFWATDSDPIYNWVDLIATTEGNFIKRRFSHRFLTQYGQVMPRYRDLSMSMIDWQVYSYQNQRTFLLHPGEAFVVRLDMVAAIEDPSSNMWQISLVWEERDPTNAPYTISGTVTNTGSPVSGAKVTIIVADDIDLLNATFWGTKTTIGDGTWSASIPYGKKAFAYCQYYTGGPTYYTSPGVPYLS